ncbi:hypothetical protein HPT25_21515 [Bacillus sp. BRMEA1]|uniref:hypothetical protein n=1 Tax=Neobacillus endophyticus TaxID=2738405 RepID=UPI001C27EE84|nr:hypothetical protein [Neobacillus endophyticus]NRD79917.1 hypothetical protein [Neobacillus endophyticus]
MSFPNIPNVTPSISITSEDVLNLLLASVAFEELGLAHILNAEGEKIQFAIKNATSIADLFAANQSVNKVLKTVIKKEMLLQFKLEDIIELMSSSSSSSTSTTTTTTSTSTTTSTTSNTRTTTRPFQIIFRDIASATGMTTAGDMVSSEDDSFYHTNFSPDYASYTFTQSPINDVPQGPVPSIQVIKQVSIDGGMNWLDAEIPPGPELTHKVGKAWFRILVLNNGNSILNNVIVTDPSLGLETVITDLANGVGVAFVAQPI